MCAIVQHVTVNHKRKLLKKAFFIIAISLKTSIFDILTTVMRYHRPSLLIFLLISTCLAHAQEIKSITQSNGQKVYVVPTKAGSEALTLSADDVVKQMNAAESV